MYILNGKVVVRSKAFKIEDAKTENQLRVRARIKRMAKIYHDFDNIICLGFPKNSDEKTLQNMFLKSNFKTAFETIDKVEAVSYPLLLLSKGSLPEVKVLEAVTNAEGITVRYDADVLSDNMLATDEIIACARLLTGELLIARQIRGYEAIGTILLKYPSLLAEDVSSCYVFARSGDVKKASNSVYVEVNR